MKYFLGEVDESQTVRTVQDPNNGQDVEVPVSIYDIAQEASMRVMPLGGRVEIGQPMQGGNPLMLLILPDEVEDKPEDLVGYGIKFSPQRRMDVPAVQDQGIS